MYWDCVRSFIWGILYIFVTFYFSERGKAGLRSLRWCTVCILLIDKNDAIIADRTIFLTLRGKALAWSLLSWNPLGKFTSPLLLVDLKFVDSRHQVLGRHLSQSGTLECWRHCRRTSLHFQHTISRKDAILIVLGQVWPVQPLEKGEWDVATQLSVTPPPQELTHSCAEEVKPGRGTWAHQRCSKPIVLGRRAAITNPTSVASDLKRHRASLSQRHCDRSKISSRAWQHRQGRPHGSAFITPVAEHSEGCFRCLNSL